MSAAVLWGVAGLLLLASELVLPGVFLMWVGLAALSVAAVSVLVEPSPQIQVLVFAVLSALFSVAGWRFYRARREKPDAADSLNDTTTLMVGRTGTLVEPIVGGQGRARIGDTLWLVKGDDLPGGTTVRVVAQDGVVMRVTPVA